MEWHENVSSRHSSFEYLELNSWVHFNSFTPLWTWRIWQIIKSDQDLRQWHVSHVRWRLCSCASEGPVSNVLNVTSFFCVVFMSHIWCWALFRILNVLNVTSFFCKSETDVVVIFDVELCLGSWVLGSGWACNGALLCTQVGKIILYFIHSSWYTCGGATLMTTGQVLSTNWRLPERERRRHCSKKERAGTGSRGGFWEHSGDHFPFLPLRSLLAPQFYLFSPVWPVAFLGVEHPWIPMDQQVGQRS